MVSRAPLRCAMAAAVLLFGSASGADALSGTEVSQYLRGRAAMLDGAFDEAARALTPLADSADIDLSVHNLAIYSNLLAGRYEEAVSGANRAAMRGKRSWPHTLVLFSDRVREQKWEEALSLIAGDAGSVWVDLLAAWVEHGAGDSGRGIERLRLRQASLADTAEQRSPLQHVTYHLGLLELAVGQEPEGLESLNQAMDFAVPGYRSVLERGSRLEATKAEALYLGAVRDYPERAIYESLLLGDAEPRLVRGPVDGVAEALLSIAELTRWVSGPTGSRVPLHAAAALRPADSEIAYALGTRLARIGQFGEAISTLRAAGSAAREIRLAAAEALLEGGDVEGSVSVYQELIDEEFGEPWLTFSLAEVFRRSENYEAARDWYSVSLENYEEVLAALNGIGVASAMDGRSLDDWALSGEFHTPLRDSLTEIPALPEGERREYVRMVADHLRMEPSLWPAYFGRGIAQERLGEWPAAEVDLQRALRISNGHPSVANYLGYYWIDNGIHLERGLELLEEALDNRPDDPYILDSVGWALYRVGDYDGALQLLEKALHFEPGVAEIYDHFGDVLWTLGYRTEANYQWKRALTLDPEEHIRERAERKAREGLGILPQ